MQMELKVEPKSPPVNFVDQPFVWPWIGVLANIPLQWEDVHFVGPSGFMLKQQLSQRGFNPLNVEILWTLRGHSGFALVEFEKDYQGLQHATLFDMSFQASHCGNKDWNNIMACPEVKLYGWVARKDDYKFEGIVGQHLRMFRDSNGAFVYNRSMRDHNEMHPQVDGFSSCVEGLMKQEDEMFHCYNEDMRKTHQSSQKHFEKIISRREMVTVLLEAQKQEIEMRSTELVEGFVVSNETELRKIQNQKYMIEEATLAQRKGDHNFVQLVEQHKKEKEELHKQITDFEKDVDDKHGLQLEIERMRGALRVMRHIGDSGDGEILEKMDTIQGKLKEKEVKYKGFEAMDQTLIVKHQRNNDQLQGGKELTKYLKKGSRNMSACVTRGHHLDSKPFFYASKRKYSEEKEYDKALDQNSVNNYFKIAASIWSLWKKEIDLDEERLKCIRNVHGEVYNAGRKKKGSTFVLKR